MCLLKAILDHGVTKAMGAQALGQPARADSRDVGRAPAGRPALIARGTSKTNTRTSPVFPGDNMTLRPTVIVRRGTSQGSGTIIASIEGETLVLTAAHVLRAQGPIVVELHRYNVGRDGARRQNRAAGRAYASGDSWQPPTLRPIWQSSALRKRGSPPLRGAPAGFR